MIKIWSCGFETGDIQEIDWEEGPVPDDLHIPHDGPPPNYSVSLETPLAYLVYSVKADSEDEVRLGIPQYLEKTFGAQPPYRVIKILHFD
jgi:hypothetical protein